MTKEAVIKFFETILQMLFGKPPVAPKEPEDKAPAGPFLEITRMPAYGENGGHVTALQKALGDVDVDGSFGPKTKASVEKFQLKNGLAGSGILGPKTLELLRLKLVEPAKPVTPAPTKTGTPWLDEARKHTGKVETNSEWQAKLGAMWGKAGLPQFKGLVGSARAWCALFILANLSWAGFEYTRGNASAISWDNFGQKIEYKVNGIPEGAIVRINSSGNCKSSSGNHVTFANGSCTPADVNKSGATFSGFGGNQGDSVKVSNYSVSKICSVRWPNETALPEKVTVSKNCSNGKTDTNESTR